MPPDVGHAKQTGATVLSRALEPKGGSVPPEGARFILDLGIREVDKKRMLKLLDNFHKGPNIAGIDSETGRLTRLFNPRRQRWIAHFAWAGPVLVGKTAIGRTTLYVLNMNHPDRVEVRRLLIAAGLFPP